MSLYALPENQVWRQSPSDFASAPEAVGFSACNQYGILGPEGDSSEQEDLVARFARQMSMATQTPPRTSSQAPRPIVYSITQHYHHSSHVAREEIPDGASREHFSMPTDTAGLDGILMSHNIDPSSLSSMQRRLFEYAMPDQRSRLLQMWQICPANSSRSVDETMEGCHAQNLANRCTRPTPNQTMQLSHPYDVEMCDHFRHENEDDGQSYAEPYMISGYDDTAQKSRELSAHATMSLTIEPTTGAPYKVANDPVYGFGGPTAA